MYLWIPTILNSGFITSKSEEISGAACCAKAAVLQAAVGPEAVCVRVQKRKTAASYMIMWEPRRKEMKGRSLYAVIAATCAEVGPRRSRIQ
jgi:hypothetical protein